MINLIPLITRYNKYSFNALFGALENSILIKETNVLKAFSERDIFENLKSRKERDKVNLVMFSFSSFDSNQSYEVLNTLKNRICQDNIKYICGGPHPTAKSEECLDSGFDLVFKGESEKSFICFLEQLASKEEGIFGKRIIQGEKIDLNEYNPFSFKLGMYGPIEITRGCRFGCNFCQTSKIFGYNERHRNVKAIVDTVRQLSEKNLTDIRFISPNAFGYMSKNSKKPNLEKIEELLSGVRDVLINKGKIFFGSFPSEVRPDFVNMEVLKLVREYCNNDNIVIGGQSGSDDTLIHMGRKHSSEDLFNSIELTHSAGLKPVVDLIFGLPEETEKSLMESVEFMEKIVKIGAKIHCHTFMPLPGTNWENKQSVKIPEKMRLYLKNLVARGKLFGQWEKQEKFIC